MIPNSATFIQPISLFLFSIKKDNKILMTLTCSIKSLQPYFTFHTLKVRCYKINFSHQKVIVLPKKAHTNKNKF